MKNSRSVLFKLFAVIAVVAAFTAFTFALSACNETTDPPNNPDAPDAVNFVYTQSERIGWDQSILNFGDSKYAEYKNNGSPSFVVPGLSEGQNFILQGIAYCPSFNWTLLCGYVNPATELTNSVIFVMDMNKTATTSSGKTYAGALIKEIFLKNEDGTAFKGHVGGIAVTEKNVWVSNSKKLYRISLQTVKDAPASGEIEFEGYIDVPVLSSYCSYSDGILWVGEFEYAKDNYVTSASHHNAENSALKAWTVGYRVNENGADGFDAVTGLANPNADNKIIPDYVLWHGEKVQGMTEAGNKIVLSTSYGRKNDSALYIYDNPVRSSVSPDLTVEIYGAQVDCWRLSTASKKVVAPPMTEDVAVKKEGSEYKIFVASESAAYYYHGYNTFNKSKNPTDLVWLYTVTQ